MHCDKSGDNEYSIIKSVYYLLVTEKMTTIFYFYLYIYCFGSEVKRLISENNKDTKPF